MKKPEYSLASEAILVTLNMGKLKSSVREKKVEEDTIRKYGNAGDTTRTTKKLFKGSIDELTKSQGQIRVFHYTLTLPWNDNNKRLLPSKKILEYTEGINNLISEHEAKIAEFFKKYVDYINQDKALLKDLFDTSNYLSLEQARQKFYVKVSYEPIEEVGDFRIELKDKAIEEIKRQFLEDRKLFEEKSKKDLWARLYKVVKHMSERLKADGKLHESIVTNITELIELLPQLNVLQDKELDKMLEEVKTDLTSIPIVIVKDSEEVRKVVAKKADDILNKMASYI